MLIKNLCLHSSSEHGAADYYTADLDKDGEIIPIELSKGNGGKWVAYNCKTGVIYPIESVGNNKSNIADWSDGDNIVLGETIRRDN